MHDWKAFADFMDSIYAAKEGLGLRSHQDAFFRGHSKSTYKLLPSLFRQKNDPDEPNYFWHLERRTFFQFRTLARELEIKGHDTYSLPNGADNAEIGIVPPSSLYVYAFSPPTCESQYVVGSVKNSPCLQRLRIASSLTLIPRPGPVGTGM